MAIPKTVRTYSLNGTLKDFTIPFEYLARKFVVVTLIGATRQELILNTDYRFSTANQITTIRGAAWGSGDGFEMIEIRRFTSATDRLVDFTDGSILRAYDLNTAQIQSLHIAEEARDLTADTIGVNNDGNLDARGKRIVNVADGIDPGDAVTVRQQESWALSALNQAIASANSATASQVSRLASEAASVVSINARNASGAFADESENSANESEASNQAALIQANRSETQANASQVSAVASAASAAAALTSKNAAASSATTAATLSARFLSPAASNPTTRADGSALQIGDRYLNTTIPGLEMIYKSTGWEPNNLDMAAMAASNGSGLIGHQSTVTDAVVETMRSAMSRQISPETFGAVGNNVADDTVAFQKATAYLARNGGGVLRCTAGRKYLILGSIILCAFVQVDLNGCEIRGQRVDVAATFVTGYINGSNVIVNNLNSPNETILIDGVRVFNGRMTDCFRAFFFKNANVTCAIRDITFYNVLQSWLLRRCFCMQLKNCFSSAGSDPLVATYKFEGAVNSITLDQVRAVTEFGFEFGNPEGDGSGDILILNCDFEGGSRGFYFAGQTFAITFVAGYFEAIRGVLFDFVDAKNVSITWERPYIFLVDIVLREPLDPLAQIQGTWNGDEPFGAGSVNGGYTYRGLIYNRHPRNAIQYNFPAVFDNSTDLKANFVTDGVTSASARQESVRWGSGAGDVLSRAVLTRGVIPLHYTGDTGRVYSNQVAFATHQAYQPGNASIIVLVRTKILWRPDTTFAKYRFAVTDANGTTYLFGDIYGSSVKAADATGKTVLVTSGPGGFMQVELYGFTHPTGVYTCTGTVQLCT